MPSPRPEICAYYTIGFDKNPAGRMEFRILRIEKILSYYPFCLAGQNSHVQTYLHLKQMTLKVPIILPNRRRGQFCNPAELIKEHWDAYKRQNSNDTVNQKEEANSSATGELESSLNPQNNSRLLQ